MHWDLCFKFKLFKTAKLWHIFRKKCSQFLLLNPFSVFPSWRISGFVMRIFLNPSKMLFF